jgi:hypothetical protein
VQNPAFHLAHVNIALMRAGYDDPLMAGFVAQLDEVNALAEASPGFVWRFQTDDDAAIARRVFGDPLLLFNVSVWESLETLRTFVYGPRHRAVMQARGNWFRPMPGPNLALWWVPAGTLPSVEEAAARLSRLRQQGPGPEAFTFRQPFPAPACAPRPGADAVGPGVC